MTAPTRRLDALVARWPTREAVLAAARAWAERLRTTDARILRIVLFGSYARDDAGPGSDADLVIVDLHKRRVVRPASLHTQTDFSLYEGKTLRGWPVMTIQGGVVAVEDNEILVKPGRGRVLRRSIGT